MAVQRSYHSLREKGLDHDSRPMRLWQKGKELGTWDPKEIDFTQDREDWEGAETLEQEVLLHLSALFCGGEESVTEDLLPLIMAISDEGRLEEEMYLTSFLFEEAKHVEVFRRFFDEVVGYTGDLTRFHGDHYRAIFDDALPTAMNRLRTDPSPKNQAIASATYNMIVEGVLAETGYHAYRSTLEKKGMMPGMQEVTGLLKRDESRHMAFGVYLLSRLVAEHGEPVWQAIEETMTSLLPHATGMIEELFDQYERMPLGLEVGEFVEYALDQFQKRRERIASARDKTVAEVR
jgi:ribonucleoside-diphosphate reductase beta chain